MTVLAWINNQTMVCENTSLDPRPASEIHIDGYLMLDLEQTPSAHWEWNDETQDWILINDPIGQGGIGDVWDGTTLITPKSSYQAAADQPTTTGTQTL